MMLDCFAYTGERRFFRVEWAEHDKLGRADGRHRWGGAHQGDLPEISGLVGERGA